MSLRRIGWEGDLDAVVRRLRSLAPPDDELIASVEEIVSAVSHGGDAALLELTERHDGARPETLRVDPEALTAARSAIDPALRDALEVAAVNIERVSRAQLAPAADVELPQGHRVVVGRRAVGAAGAYVPGGRNPYPSTVLMTVIPAKVAGVRRVVVVSPPGPSGKLAPEVLAACAIAGADEVYACGGAQAVAALAYGTETIAPVDVIAGPGSAWVQEAKLAVSRTVRIDGYAGPSELMVVCDRSAPADWIAADLCAQAEHGEDSPVIAVSADTAWLEDLGDAVEALASERETVSDAPIALVAVPDAATAIELANAFAPEHLQLACEGADALAAEITTAGCVFVGAHGATAFGDYAAGSNHVLPTGGSGRFNGPLGPGAFSRPISLVHFDSESAVRLAPAVDLIARSEGFAVHGESTTIRTKRDGEE